MRTKYFGLTSVLMLALMVATPVSITTHALAASAPHGSRQLDRQIQGEITDSLKGSRFKNVQASVTSGIVYLSGTVDLFADKEDAAKKASRNKSATAVRNEIEVAGPQESDDELQNKLVRKVQYDRVGYGTTAFNAIGVSVRNGTAILSGHAYGPSDKYSALAVAGNMPGVKDVVDEIDVDPISPMDDRIRVIVARSIYGYPSLNKYAIDPGKPIRISVQNGNVTLFGLVDSQMDKDVANMRANSVAGVFKVTNQLDVAGEAPKGD
jgi:hyperosmotically inducible protein